MFMTQIRLKLLGSKSEKTESVTLPLGCAEGKVDGHTQDSQGKQTSSYKRICSQDDLAEKLYLGYKNRARFMQCS